MSQAGTPSVEPVLHVEGYFALDPDWRFVEMNTVAERHFGRAAQELRGRTIWQVTGRGTDSPLCVAFRHAADRREAVRLDVESRVQPGRWFEIHLHPRATGGLDVCFHDVTERRDVERQLREQVAAAGAAHRALEQEKRRLEAVLNALPVGVAITDATGGDIQSNEAFQNVWHGPRPSTASVDDYAAYKAWWADTGVAVRPHEWASALAVETGATVVGQLLEIERFDGTRAFVSNSAAPIRDADGRIVGSAVAIQDVTAMRQADAAIRESEDRYRRLFDHMAEGCFLAEVICDEAGEPVDYRYLAVNPALESLTNLKQDEVVGRTVAEVLPGFERYWLETYGRVALTGQPARIEEFAAPLGRYYSTVAYATRPGQFACLFSDITARKLADLESQRLLAAVREEKERLAALVNSISDEVWFCDARRQFTLANASALREFRMTASVALDVGDFARSLEVLRPDGTPRPVDEAPPLRALSGEVVRNQEEIIRTPATGELRYREVSASPARDAAGEIIGSVTVVRDITERKRAEEALRAREAALAEAQRLAHIGSWYWDARSDVTTGSDELLRIYGFDPATQAMPDFEHQRGVCYPVEDLERIQAAVRATMATGEPCELDVRVFRNGAAIWVTTRGEAVRDASGRVIALRGTAQDITERKRAEEALREANERLADADRRKDEFIAILSHELRNPLAPIRYAVPVLQAERLGDSASRAISVIDRQVKHLTRLVDDLLDVGRIAGGKIELRLEQVTLRSVVTAALEGAAPAMASVPHTLQVTVADERMWLHADAARLTQVLTNLLENSAKFTPAGGHIALEAAREGDRAVVRVHDSGIGIAAGDLPVIFEMFRQVARPQGLQGGLGIGLAVAKRLVEMHGGTIDAHSEGPGRGAEFVVRLPVAPDTEPEVAPCDSSAELPAGRRLKVLVVDDNVDLVDMLAIVVAGAGHDVEKAYDGASAIERAVSWSPDVVLLDLGMPEMSGIEVARELRRHPQVGRARLVALTGWGQAEDRRRTREAGFDHHLTKPAEPDAVRELLAMFAADLS